MFEGIQVVYVYEGSKALIRLPPFPVRFDSNKVAFAIPALQALEKSGGAMTRAEFEQRTNAKKIWSHPDFRWLLEEAGEIVDLSGAGVIALSQFELPPASARLCVHEKARKSGQFRSRAVQTALPRMTNQREREKPEHCATHSHTDMKYSTAAARRRSTHPSAY